jgi:putative PIN family toxin of toxin-antitoxin system
MSGRVRVVLDTNVIVSGLVYRSNVPDRVSTPGRLVALWRGGGLDVALSRYIVDETLRVLPRLKHAQVRMSEILDFLDALLFLADIVEPLLIEEASLRDKADGPVLGTFLAAGADYLITGDKDLLALAGKYPVLTPGEFWARHG